MNVAFFFLENLHENENVWSQMGAGAYTGPAPMDLPMIMFGFDFTTNSHCQKNTTNKIDNNRVVSVPEQTYISFFNRNDIKEKSCSAILIL